VSPEAPINAVCLSCGKAVPLGAKFCRACGAAVAQGAPSAREEALLCQGCGAPLKAGAKFCKQCGRTTSTVAAVDSSASPATEAAPPLEASTSRPAPQSQPSQSEESSSPLPDQAGQKPTCPSCGKVAGSGSKFCKYCGGKLAEPARSPVASSSVAEVLAPAQLQPPPIESAAEKRICPSCGVVAETGKKFCRACGARLEPDAASSPAVSGPTLAPEIPIQMPAPAPSENARAAGIPSPRPSRGTPSVPTRRKAWVAAIAAAGVILLVGGGFLAYRWHSRKNATQAATSFAPSQPIAQSNPEVVEPPPSPSGSETSQETPSALTANRSDQPSASGKARATESQEHEAAANPGTSNPPSSSGQQSDQLETPATPPNPSPAQSVATPNVGATSGTLTWTGQVPNYGLIIINGNHVSPGSIEGELPGVPVKIEIDPPGMGIAEAPSLHNNWKRLVLRPSKQRPGVIHIRWTVIP
jgi:predicted amidophosphoribosyltransferase